MKKSKDEKLQKFLEEIIMLGGIGSGNMIFSFVML